MLTLFSSPPAQWKWGFAERIKLFKSQMDSLKEINILKVQVNGFLEKQLLKARCKYLYFSPFPASNPNPRPESEVSVGLDWCTMMVALCTSLRLPPRFPALHLISLDEHHPWQLVPSQSQPSPSATSPSSTPPLPTSKGSPSLKSGLCIWPLPVEGWGGSGVVNACPYGIMTKMLMT